MISEQLKKYRHNAQLSQDDVARALNVSRQAVSRWENQRTYPDIDNLVRLGKLYSVPVDTLLSEDVDIQKGLSHNNEHINDLKKASPFLKRNLYNAQDESMELMILVLVSGIVPLMGILITVYIALRNNKFNRLYIWIYVAATIVFIYSFVNCAMSIYDLFFTNFHLHVNVS
ncbi:MULTISPECIES: helix-turn-helix domain-containing protein [Lactiplantibacillus]|uniref:Helix-turn-helix transcriptional regulator n=1 Tax=Lactiplantibacillus pentosus TaxID=1589 RepID=A0AAW8WK96_LACPE|nr:helix-turn-helix transcriptional regulator [Lactiplantibacillus pentosus]MBU7484801.1 helix-turn-helix transcriptional regulator [Lactiplantibacillus sp. 30.2.29]AUI77362.1 hypothetical protein BB562_00970 [Lactiplantibacillus pentosus]MBU7461671.1 helix-turn-helix transcriptional regulator [Lactiplantibacillus pentosus]MBU7477873.1 helix-turn-helix transcriptional regulator [Lactiplantibacillus pentosus]MBU7487612.1 helix-turn-helix transcriptional regulator [Lactiplantibacillus pentosus]